MQTSVQVAPGAASTAQASAPIARPSPSLGELVHAYLEAFAGRDSTRPATLAFWRDELGPERPFHELDDEDVLRGLDALRVRPARVYAGRDAAGRPIHRARGKLSPTTVNRYHAALMALFTWSIKRRLAPKGWDNPARKIERAPERNQVVRWLTDAERERLLEACRRSTWPRLYVLVLMAITTGARRGELVGLTWGDVDLDRGLAFLADTKNGERRALPLTPAVLAELKRFRCERTDVCVFPARGAKGLFTPRQFEAAWRQALAESRVKRFRFHDLRHTAASYLAQQGKSLLEIADFLGHRQLAMTKRYSHLTVATKARLVNEVFGGIK